MRIIITGTPGTGKTSVSSRLSQLIKKKVVHLNEVIMAKHLYKDYDEDRESYVVDLEKLEEECDKFDDVIIEGHLSHFCIREGDVVVVLRANPLILKRRLRKKRYNPKKIQENIEAEIVDIILQDVLDITEKYKDVEVYEIDTSDKTIDRVAIIIKKILEDKRYAQHFLPGRIDFTNYLLEGKI